MDCGGELLMIISWRSAVSRPGLRATRAGTRRRTQSQRQVRSSAVYALGCLKNQAAISAGRSAEAAERPSTPSPPRRCLSPYSHEKLHIRQSPLLWPFKFIQLSRPSLVASLRSLHDRFLPQLLEPSAHRPPRLFLRHPRSFRPPVYFSPLVFSRCKSHVRNACS